MARELSQLQKEYADFFWAKLDEFGVETPAALTDEKKSEFFNAIKKDWKVKKRELAKDGILPVSEDMTAKQKMRAINEVVAIRKYLKEVVLKAKKRK